MKTFKPYAPNQIYLLPPNMADWLPEGHLALFIGDVVDQMDLKEIYADYEKGDRPTPVSPRQGLLPNSSLPLWEGVRGRGKIENIWFFPLSLTLSHQGRGVF